MDEKEFADNGGGEEVEDNQENGAVGTGKNETSNMRAEEQTASKNSPDGIEAEPESNESYPHETYETDELPEDTETIENSEYSSSSMYYNSKVTKA